MSEFSIIEKYFSVLGKQRTDVILAVGDDAALVNTSNIQSLAISVDTLIGGVHFPLDTRAYDIGWKALAVNLSDMAAMAADPRWATLALTLPEINDQWLAEFCRGFESLAILHDVQLIGGDTTRGALSISVQIIGGTSASTTTRRDKAVVGDSIHVTGVLGDAALGLKLLTASQEIASSLSVAQQQALFDKLNRPWPRVSEALKLAPYVNAAIDISDGLLADLSHILSASQVAGVIDVNAIPVSHAYRILNQNTRPHDLALCGGDDYELCFTVAKNMERNFLLKTAALNLKCTKIGEIAEGAGLTFLNDNQEYIVQQKPYDHF